MRDLMTTELFSATPSDVTIQEQRQVISMVEGIFLRDLARKCLSTIPAESRTITKLKEYMEPIVAQLYTTGNLTMANRQRVPRILLDAIASDRTQYVKKMLSEHRTLFRKEVLAEGELIDVELDNLTTRYGYLVQQTIKQLQEEIAGITTLRVI